MEDWSGVWPRAECVPAGLLLLDVAGPPRLLAANREALRLLRRTEAELRAAPESLPLTPETLRAPGAQRTETRLVCGRPTLVRSRNLGGGRVLCVLLPLPADGCGCRLDPLTGLPDRAAFQRGVGAVLRSEPGLCAFVILDLDDFKRVNDTHGHPAGDAVLLAVAERLRAAFRRGDLLCRLGGDEFAVFVRDLPSPAQLRQRVERLLSALSREVRRGEPGVTCSVGAAFYPREGRSFSQLYARADEALYASKRRGKNRLTMTD